MDKPITTEVPEILRCAILNDDIELFDKLVNEGFVSFFVPTVLDYLKRLTKKNPKSMHKLCETRVALEMDKDDEDPPLKVMGLDGKEGLFFGIIGIINGIIEDFLGTDKALVAGLYDGTGKLVGFVPHHNKNAPEVKLKDGYDSSRLDNEIKKNRITLLENALKTLKEDAEMALSEEWDRGDDGFQAQLILIDNAMEGVE